MSSESIFKLLKSLSDGFERLILGSTSAERQARAKAQAVRSARARTLRQVQEEAEFQKNLELAKKGQYHPPAPKPAIKQNPAGDIGKTIMSFGKRNPLEGTSFDMGTRRQSHGRR